MNAFHLDLRNENTLSQKNDTINQTIIVQTENSWKRYKKIDMQ